MWLFLRMSSSVSLINMYVRQKLLPLIAVSFMHLCIGLIVFLSSCSGENSDSGADSIEKPGFGRWREANEPRFNERAFEDQVNRLSSIGYLQGYREAPVDARVTIYDRGLAHDGLNLFDSGHAAEAGLMDMEGKVWHRWAFDFEDFEHPFDVSIDHAFVQEATTHWRRVHLYDNGDLLAIYENLFMIKLDKDSNLLWVSPIGGFHHHMQVADDGTIYALVKNNKMLPVLNSKEEVVDDHIVTMSPDGIPIEAVSIFECFENSSYAHLINEMPKKGEIFHTNTLQILDATQSRISDRFKEGNILISMLFMNTIALLSLEDRSVVWALNGHDDGLWNGMHESILLESGNILIFDNNWGPEGIRRDSKVIEFHPFTGQIAWQYNGDLENPFYSRTCGTSQRLPNGNTLITESDNGRAFEVTKDGKIVWEFINPHRAGANNELIATLLHVHRIDHDSVPWLARTVVE